MQAIKNSFTSTNAYAGMIVLFIFSSLFYYANYQIKKSMEAVQVTELSQMLNTTSSEIEHTVEAVGLISRNIELLTNQINDEIGLDSFLIQYLNLDHCIIGAYYLNESKDIISYWQKSSGRIIKSNSLPENYLGPNERNRIWLFDSKPIDDGKEQVFTYQVKLNKGNGPCSVFGIEISLGAIEKSLLSIFRKTSVEYYIIGPENKIWKHSNEHLIGHLMTEGDSLYKQLIWSKVPKSERVLSLQGNKQDYFKFIQPISMDNLNRGKNGFVGVKFPSSLVLKEYYLVRRYLLIVGAIGFVLIFFFIVYSIYQWKRIRDEKDQVDVLLNSAYAQLLSYIEGSDFVNIYSLDRNYCYLNFNSFHQQEIERNFNKKPRIGDNVKTILPAKFWEVQKKHFDRALSGEHFMTTLQSEHNRYYQQIFNPIYDTGRGVVGITCSFINITDKVVSQRELENYREHLEELVEERTKELRNQKEFLQMLIDQVPNQVFVRDQDGRYVLVNKASAIAFNMSIEDLVGKTLLETHHNLPEAELYHLEDQTILKDDIVVSYEDKLRNRVGEEQWVIVNKGRIKLFDQYFVMGVLMDISHLKETEDRLQKANVELGQTISKLQNTQYKLIESEKMASLGQLMGGIAHEINNPINFVAGNVRPLMQDFDDVRNLISELEEKFTDGPIHSVIKKYSIGFVLDEMESLLNGISDGAGRIGNIVTNLKNFAKPSLGEFAKSDLREGLIATINLVRFNVRHRIEITTDFQEIPDVICTPAKINQVFLNLITNAIQAIKDKGKIHIKTELEESSNSVLINISDTGSGIPKEYKNKIFDPFFTTKDVGKGTGLGLSLSFSIIQQHDGEIDFEDNVPKGTVFRIKLPIDRKKD